MQKNEDYLNNKSYLRVLMLSLLIIQIVFLLQDDTDLFFIQFEIIERIIRLPQFKLIFEIQTGNIYCSLI